MMKTCFLVGNWKMNKSLRVAREDFQALVSLSKTLNLGSSKLAIAAPLLACAEIAKSGSLLGVSSSSVSLFAQHCHFAKQGAFTGETPVSHLKELGIAGSILGHSERRSFYGDNNLTIGKSAAALLSEGLHAIVCVGETLSERESGNYLHVVQTQLEEIFAAAEMQLGFGMFTSLVAAGEKFTLAYEPVWAIGTGKAASPEMAQEVHVHIRKCCENYFGSHIGKNIEILYGGSVTAQNSASFFAQTEVNGALVGGASLVPQDFLKLLSPIK